MLEVLADDEVGTGYNTVQCVLAEAREGWLEVDPVGELYGPRRGKVDGWAAGRVVGEVSGGGAVQTSR